MGLNSLLWDGLASFAEGGANALNIELTLLEDFVKNAPYSCLRMFVTRRIFSLSTGTICKSRNVKHYIIIIHHFISPSIFKVFISIVIYSDSIHPSIRLVCPYHTNCCYFL